MKDKTYPAICRAVDGKEYLYANKNNYYSYQCSAWDKSDSSDNHENDTNITREYLEGKCVKIESPEHSELVQKLAFNAGFEWTESGKVIAHTNAKYLFFYTNGDLTFGVSNKRRVIEVTIPLPPKAEHKEWPAIGDKASYGGNINCKVVGIHNEVAMILAEHGDYHIAYLSELSKPKTEAEILRDDLWEAVLCKVNKGVNKDELISDLLDRYNITKKPQ